MLRGRSQLTTLAIIALSILVRLQMVGRVLDREYMDLHVRKIAAVSRKGTYTLLEESAWLSWGNVFSNCTLLLESKDLLWRFSWLNVDFIMVKCQRIEGIKIDGRVRVYMFPREELGLGDEIRIFVPDKANIKIGRRRARE